MPSSGGLPVSGNTPTTNVYNGNNQIGGASYDAAGNQTVVNGNTNRQGRQRFQFGLCRSQRGWR
jgi:hypothetical protein